MYASRLTPTPLLDASVPFTVPCIVNGERVTSGALVPQGVPHDHAAGPLCNFHSADAALVRKAIEGAVAVRSTDVIGHHLN